MAKPKPYYYLVDRLTDGKADIIRKGLLVIRDIASVNVSVAQSMVEVISFRDVESEVKLACDVAQVTYRTRAKQ